MVRSTPACNAVGRPGRGCWYRSPQRAGPAVLLLAHAFCPGLRRVGDQFISKYYDVLCKLPQFQNRFYKEGSLLTVTIMHEDGTSSTNTAEGSLDVSGAARGRRRAPAISARS
jgi:hypothetical protein